VGLARIPPRAQGDLRLVDIVARSQRAEWYVHQLSCAVLRGPCSEAADARAALIPAQTDPAAITQLTAEALGALTAANVYIPLGAPVRWSLVRDRVDGFSPNSAALHPLAAFAEPGS